MSTEYIVLGGEKPKTKVDQGDGVGRVEVSGSTMHARDPMEAEARAELALLQSARAAAASSGTIHTKWCSHKDHEGPRDLPTTMFSADTTRYDGRYPYCKACAARAKRDAYAAKAAAQGRSVRPYHRHTP